MSNIIRFFFVVFSLFTFTSVAHAQEANDDISLLRWSLSVLSRDSSDNSLSICAMREALGFIPCGFVDQEIEEFHKMVSKRKINNKIMRANLTILSRHIAQSVGNMGDQLPNGSHCHAAEEEIWNINMHLSDRAFSMGDRDLLTLLRKILPDMKEKFNDFSACMAEELIMGVK